jgi:hypothetical protein
MCFECKSCLNFNEKNYFYILVCVVPCSQFDFTRSSQFGCWLSESWFRSLCGARAKSICCSRCCFSVHASGRTADFLVLAPVSG